MSILDRGDVRTLICAIAVSSLAGLLYFFTAARDIVVGDSPELIIAATILGVAHPPGYPLFTMLGHLFSLLPLGSIPFRVNLLAAACDALAVGVVFLTAFQLSRSRLAAAMASLILALNPFFWSWSLVAEVFPLNNLLASLLIYLFVVWYEQPERTGVLVTAFFFGGLALTNHQTIVLLGPAFCLLLWQRRAVLWSKPQILALCVLAFLLGLLPYAYVPWAAAHHPAYNWGGVSSLKDLFGLITRQSYGGRHLVDAAYRGGSSVDRVLTLCLSFGALMGLLAVLGLVRAYRHRRWYFWFSALAFAFAGPFFVIITDLNLATAPQGFFVLQRFFLLPQVIAAPLVALGIVMIAEFAGSYAPALPISPLRLVTGGALAVLLVSLLTNYRRIDQSHNHIARNYAEDVFATVEPGTILLVTGDGLALPLLYLNLVERTRPDVTLIFPMVLPADWYVRQLREQNPDLNVPFDYYDVGRSNLKMLIEANPGRPIGIIGALRDKSLNQDYWPYPYGLVNLTEPKTKRITLAQMVNDNERLMKRYRTPSPGSINAKSFESDILTLYAQSPWRIGVQYEGGGWKSEAGSWYERALAIDPSSPQTREALARVQHDPK